MSHYINNTTRMDRVRTTPAIIIGIVFLVFWVIFGITQCVKAPPRIDKPLGTITSYSKLDNRYWLIFMSDGSRYNTYSGPTANGIHKYMRVGHKAYLSTKTYRNGDVNRKLKLVDSNCNCFNYYSIKGD